MTFVDLEITRRQFAARYVNLGRGKLDHLASVYGLDGDVAAHWADQIDREQEIAAVRIPFPGGGIEGTAGLTPAAPSTHSPRS